VICGANGHLLKNKFDLLKSNSSNSAIRYFGPRQTSTIPRDATLPNKLLKCGRFSCKMGVSHFPCILRSSCNKSVFLEIIVIVFRFVIVLRLEVLCSREKDSPFKAF
jgi:hypothetical protein